MFSLTKSLPGLSALLFLLNNLPSPAVAADLSNYPQDRFPYYSNLYQDAWTVRSSLCTQGTSGVVCDGGNCSFQAGNVFGYFEAPDFNTAMSVCWDAYNDIINSGIYNNYPGGEYNYNGVFYKLEVLPPTS